MLSIKQIGTICFAISILISAPLFAKTCDNSLNGTCPACKNSNLQTYSGTSNLQANWQANEIYLAWYDGDELLDVPEESWSCVYDGTLTPPPAPTKTGYTFKGWRVRPEIYLSSLGLDTSINGTDYGYASIGGGDAYNANAYGLTSDSESGEWAVTFSYGIIKGKAYCGYWRYDIDSGVGPWCTCVTTKYISLSGEGYQIIDSGRFSEDKNTLSECESSCVQYCAQTLQTSSTARSDAYTMYRPR